MIHIEVLWLIYLFTVILIQSYNFFLTTYVGLCDENKKTKNKTDRKIIQTQKTTRNKKTNNSDKQLIVY